MPPTLGNLMIPESGAYLKKGNIHSHPSGPLGLGASQGFMGFVTTQAGRSRYTSHILF